MYNREHKYVYWREERKKGKWHYIMKSFFMICCALLVGKIIGLFIFGELHTFQDVTEQFPADLFTSGSCSVQYSCSYRRQCLDWRKLSGVTGCDDW